MGAGVWEVQRAALVIASLVSDHSTREATLSHPVCEIVLLRLCQLLQADLKDVAGSAVKVMRPCIILPSSSSNRYIYRLVLHIRLVSLAGHQSAVLRCRGPEAAHVSTSGAPNRCACPTVALLESYSGGDNRSAMDGIGGD